MCADEFHKPGEYKPKVYVQYKIDQLQKALRMAERLGNREVFNWAEILRSAEEIIKNAPKDEQSQTAARRRYLEVLADMDPDALPAPLQPIVATAAAILEGDDEYQRALAAAPILAVPSKPNE